MTIEQELQLFAQALERFCKFHNVRFACLKAEHDLERAPRWALVTYLYLTHVAEELVSGQIIATAEGRNLFIRVRTPLAATSTLKFITLRTYSLILPPLASTAAPLPLQRSRASSRANPQSAFPIRLLPLSRSPKPGKTVRPVPHLPLHRARRTAPGLPICSPSGSPPATPCLLYTSRCV